MSGFTDMVEKAQAKVTSARVGSTDPKVTKAYDERRETRKSVDGYGENPAVPASQSLDEGGRFLGSAYAEGPTGDGQLDNQAQRPGNLYGNSDPEGSASHGPGSIVQSALDRGRANIASYPNHTIAGAIAEACARHQVTVYGHQKGVQASPESTFQSQLVDAPADIGDHRFMSFQASVQRLVDVFHSETGRRPVWGQPRDQQDVEFQIAYRRLRAQYWPDGTDDFDGSGGQMDLQ